MENVLILTRTDKIEQNTLKNRGDINMGTRGCYGFYVNNQEKVMYNHSDSYPEYLGKELFNFISRNDNETLKVMANEMRLVDLDKDRRNIEELKYVAGVLNRNLDIDKIGENFIDWYWVLRDVQGDFSYWENGLRVMLTASPFLGESLFCEWAYIINADTMELEIYKGLNRNEKAAGRYAHLSVGEDGYKGVALIAVYSLDYLRLMKVEQFLEEIQTLSASFSSLRERE